ncbi:MAG: aspartyl/asparaginyl beta-hydroxylase domain-containing protein [Owenweeksia sp.]
MTIPEPADTKQDRILLPFSFDVEKMTKEIQALNMDEFIYYNVIPLRAPAHTVDTSLPAPPPADDYADGSWTEWMDTNELKNSPYLMSIVDTFREHTKVTLVRALRLAPGNVVREHTDPTLGLQIHTSVIRLTIPIASGDDVDFFLNGTAVPMKPGECWYLRLTDPHKVVNSGSTDRINLTIDMIPNDWIRSIIEKADQ